MKVDDNYFQLIGKSLPEFTNVSLNTCEVFYKSNFLIFEGNFNDESIIKKVWRADMNNPGNYFEKIELVGFEHKAFPGLAIKNDEIYIFGGFDVSYTNEIIVAKLVDSNNTLVSIMTTNYFTYPQERIYSSLNAIDNRIVLFGGYSKGFFFNDMWIFYSKTKLWESIEVKGNLPSRRRNHASGTHGDALVIWGGEDKSGLKNDIFICNILRKSWKEITPISIGPSARKGACGVLNFPYFYIFGGKTYAGLNNEAWSYNFNTNLYSKLASSSTPFHNAKCQLLNGKIYILGAADNENIGLNKILYYIISENKWAASFLLGNRNYFAETISMMFPEYFIEYGGIYKNIVANKKIQIFKENDTEFNSKATGWDQKWSAFATGSAYVLSNLVYFSGGLESSLVSITKERSANKFNYISIKEITQDLNLKLYCAAGSFINSDDKCNYCPHSAFSEGIGNKKCSLCPPGTFNDNFGLSSKRQCYPCEEGRFNRKSGMKECLVCPEGKHCPAGSVEPLSSILSFSSLSIQPKSYQEPSSSQKLYDLFIIICSISLISLMVFILLIFKVRKNIAKIDLYYASHSNQVNHPLIYRKTKLGGFFTMIFIGAGIFILGLNTINYFTRNIEEMKVLQPLSVFENEVDNFKSTLNVSVSFSNYIDECAANGLCNEGVHVNYSNIEKGKIEIGCKKVNQACKITFLCTKCEIGSRSQITFKLSEAYSFSSAISVTISADSSIPEADSLMSKTIIPSNKEIFIGSTPTEFYYSLTPSVFYSQLSRYPSNATGYHVSEFSTPLPGSSYTIDNLVTESGIIAIINLEKSAFGFFTYRYEKSSAFIIFSAIIGSITGIYQVVGFLMGTLESFLESYERKTKKAENFYNLVQSRQNFQMINYNPDCFDESKNEANSDALIQEFKVF